MKNKNLWCENGPVRPSGDIRDNNIVWLESNGFTLCFGQFRTSLYRLVRFSSFRFHSSFWVLKLVYKVPPCQHVIVTAHFDHFLKNSVICFSRFPAIFNSMAREKIYWTVLRNASLHLRMFLMSKPFRVLGFIVYVFSCVCCVVVSSLSFVLFWRFSPPVSLLLYTASPLCSSIVIALPWLASPVPC